MNSMEKTELLNELDLISEFDKDQFEKMGPDFLDSITRKSNKAVCTYHGEWIPISQMRTDFDSNIYISNWLMSKLNI